jgi:hypothetical protein
MGGLFYQSEAYNIVDYELWRMEGTDEFFRGPQMVLQPQKFVAFVGAAQTFGTFCRFPFANLIAERNGHAIANLGIGGAGPTRFLIDSALMRVISQARVVVVQVMSGRSVGNTLYENLKGTSSLRPRGKGGHWTWAESVWKELFVRLPRTDLEALVAETRRNWIDEMSQLLKSIAAPKILLWISTRTPDYPEGYESIDQLFGSFPHLVNREMLKKILPLADAFVDATSARGTPQPLYDRFTGERTAVSLARPDYAHINTNGGYPSPEMHVDAAEKLAPVLRKLWDNGK